MDETWLPINGTKHPVAVVLGTQGEQLDLLSSPDFDWGGWFPGLEKRGVGHDD